MNFIKIALASSFFLIIASCDQSYTQPHLLYRAPFDPQHIEKMEALIHEIANEWGLRVYEKDREEMKFLTNGQEAFFIALYVEDDQADNFPVASVNNVGTGTVITLMITNRGEIELEELNRLAEEIVAKSRARYGIEFVLSLSTTTLQ